jgi:hypothetical protein
MREDPIGVYSATFKVGLPAREILGTVALGRGGELQATIHTEEAPNGNAIICITVPGLPRDMAAKKARPAARDLYRQLLLRCPVQDRTSPPDLSGDSFKSHEDGATHYRLHARTGHFAANTVLGSLVGRATGTVRDPPSHRGCGTRVTAPPQLR